MNIETWMLFSFAYLITTLSPGSNVLLVLKNSVQYGWKSAVLAIFGNLSCQFIIVSLVALGVGELLSRLPFWFVLLKVLGGCYLIFLGVKNLMELRKTKQMKSHRDKKTVSKMSRHFYIEAFLVSASNPKTLIFLSAFLPQFLDVEHSYYEQFLVMYLSICIIVTSVHLSYSLLVTKLGKVTIATNFVRKLSKITGGLFISMGGVVLASSRS